MRMPDSRMSSESFRSETARASCRVATSSVNSPIALVRAADGSCGDKCCCNHIDDRLRSLGVGIPDRGIAAADLIKQGSRRATRARLIPMTWGEVVANEFLQCRPGPQVAS